MNILLIAPSFYPAYGAECLVNAKLALAFLNHGWNLSVISHVDREHNFFSGSDDQLWSKLDHITHSIESTESKDFASYLIKLKIFIKTGHITNGMLWVRLCIDTAEELIKKRKFDVIISRAIPEYSHLPAMYLSNKYGIPWIANWNDPVPNCKFIQPAGQGPNAYIKPYTERFLKTVFRHAHAHTFPSIRLKKYICSYIEQDIDDKWFIVPHIALNHFNRIPTQTDKFILCHTGGLSLKARNPYYLLKPISDLVKTKKIGADVSVIFSGNFVQEIREMADTLGIASHVHAEDWVSYEKSLDLLSSGTISVVIEEEMSEGIYLPSKIADYTQTGNPILAIGPKEGTVCDYISNFGGGLYSYCKDESAIISNIEAFYTSWQNDSLQSKYPSQALAANFSENCVINIYRKIFNKII